MNVKLEDVGWGALEAEFDYYPRRYYQPTTRLPSTMPGIVLPQPSHMAAFQQPGSMFHQGVSYAAPHMSAVPSGYNPNSTHQYPRHHPPQPSQESILTKPPRPAERMRLRPWLTKMIEEQKIPGLEWEDKDKQTVKIPWKHAARHGWIKDRDASLFKAWAIHTKKYNPETDTPKANPKMWKANFRCAINSLPDIEELRDRGKTKGNDAYKVYRLIPRTKATKLKSDGSKSIKKRGLKTKSLKPNKSINDVKPTLTPSERNSGYGQPQASTMPTHHHKLTISTKEENHFQSPLSSPTSVTSLQPTTPLSLHPLAPKSNWYEGYLYQQQLQNYQNGNMPEADDYLSESGSNMTDEEIVDMVDEMIKDSPVQSPTTTIPSSPLEFDRNNNNVMWDNDVNHPLATFPLPLTQSLTSSIAPSTSLSSHNYSSTVYHPAIGIVKVEPSEDCSSSGYHRDPPPNYFDAVAATRTECIKEEPSPTYHKL
ncbi:uncharacterized protein [Apostichopus japonicus]|uniref:uncharacterized protein isoform X5 n=1 Tax=Stichopus japonicus TaxID=307972 RepID=UPI003AB3188D